MSIELADLQVLLEAGQAIQAGRTPGDEHQSVMQRLDTAMNERTAALSAGAEALMRGLAQRVGELEAAAVREKGRNSIFRVIISAVAKPLAWETSSCKRTMCADGKLLEVMELDGSSEGITDTELDWFAARFPVDRSIALGKRAAPPLGTPPRVCSKPRAPRYQLW